VRRLLGWITLLVGVVVVAGMGWYGATSLFDLGKSDGGGSTPPEVECVPATKKEAKQAQRMFALRYAEKRWVQSYGVRAVDGGSVVFVVTTAHAPDDLPPCVADVPVEYSFRGD
jgi:hypothetical protein